MARNDTSNRTHDIRSSHSTSSSDMRSQQTRDGENRSALADRDRRRDKIVDTVKSRPYAAAAVATVAAGAAAYFLTRGKSEKSAMSWGQESGRDHQSGAAAYKPQQGSTSQDSLLETRSQSPSSSAGTGAGDSASSPSSIQAASLSASGASTAASTTGSSGISSSGSSDNPNTGTSQTSGAGFGGSTASGGGKTSGARSSNAGSQTSSASGNTGLDDKSKDQTKAGAISYGA